jgi:NADH:ubiquinone reductase (H+-translocating)
MGDAPHKVVVVGGGFGGLQAVHRLRRADVEVTLIDRRNFHLFQPLSYQVATGALSATDVCFPLRWIFRRHKNVRVLMGDVTDFDLDGRAVRVTPGAGDEEPFLVPYDTLIAAGGSYYGYFGHDEWQEYAREVKSLESALAVRAQILSAFEAAELETDEGGRSSWLTFVVVGGGPTGVEMAGQIGELARDTLRREFRSIDPTQARVLLVEMADRILGSFPPKLSEKATRSLEHLGVTPLLGHRVVDIDEHGVATEDPDKRQEHIASRTVIWAAGVTASGLAGQLGEATRAEVDRAGRVLVEPDLTLPGHPEVFGFGDMVRVKGEDGKPQDLLGVAPVAMQQGRYVADVVKARLRSREHKPFRYRDKGNVATIGRSRAVADIKGLRVSGFPAWFLWLMIHIWYLIGFQNRIVVLVRWSFSFFSRGRGSRVIEEFHETSDSSRIAVRQ